MPAGSEGADDRVQGGDGEFAELVTASTVAVEHVVGDGEQTLELRS